MQEGRYLSIIRRMIGGEREESATEFAEIEMPLYSLGDVQVMLAGDFLTY